VKRAGGIGGAIAPGSALARSSWAQRESLCLVADEGEAAASSSLSRGAPEEQAVEAMHTPPRILLRAAISGGQAATAPA
jgi:hypothetical protein